MTSTIARSALGAASSNVRCSSWIVGLSTRRALQNQSAVRAGHRVVGETVGRTTQSRARTAPRHPESCRTIWMAASSPVRLTTTKPAPVSCPFASRRSRWRRVCSSLWLPCWFATALESDPESRRAWSDGEDGCADGRRDVSSTTGPVVPPVPPERGRAPGGERYERREQEGKQQRRAVTVPPRSSRARGLEGPRSRPRR